MANYLDRLGRRLVELERAQLDLATAPQLPASSFNEAALVQTRLVDSGMVDALGEPIMVEETAARFGLQPDGSNTTVSVTGPTPPQPVAPIVTAGAGTLIVEWTGEFVDRIEPYLDHDHVAIHVDTVPGFTPTAATLKATIRATQGETVTLSVPAGAYYVSLVAVSQAGVWSAPAPYSTGTPGTPGADPVWVAEVEGRLDAVESVASDAQATATTALTAANGKSKVWYSTAAPSPADGADGDTWWQRDIVTGQVSAVYEKTAGAWSPRTLRSEVIDSITAGQITSGTLQAGETINVGNPASTHIEIGDSSLQVFREDPDGNLYPSTSLGGPTTDQVFITDPATGLPVAGMFASGALIGNTLDLATPDGFSIDGETLSDILWPYARGNRVAYQATSTRPTITTTEYGLFEIQGTLPQGRIYRVNFTGLFTHQTTNGSMRLWLRSTTNGTPPQVVAPASTQLMMGWHGFTVANLPTQKSIERYFHVGSDRYGPPVTIRILVSAATLSGTAAFYPDSGVTPATFTIDDVGPLNEGFMLDGMASGGGGGSYSGVQTYTTVVPSSWTRTWRGGSIRSDTTDAIQGNYSGQHYSQIGFPTTVASTLAGATVQRIEAYLYANHWYAGAGGTAVIGVHGETSPPASFSYSGALSVPSWPRGAGKWVQLPTAWYAGFKAGTSRGITLGGGASSSASLYGRFNGTGATANRPALRLTYTK